MRSACFGVAAAVLAFLAVSWLRGERTHAMTSTAGAQCPVRASTRYQDLGTVGLSQDIRAAFVLDNIGSKVVDLRSEQGDCSGCLAFVFKNRTRIPFERHSMVRLTPGERVSVTMELRARVEEAQTEEVREERRMVKILVIEGERSWPLNLRADFRVRRVLDIDPPHVLLTRDAPFAGFVVRSLDGVPFAAQIDPGRGSSFLWRGQSSGSPSEYQVAVMRRAGWVGPDDGLVLVHLNLVDGRVLHARLPVLVR